MYSFEFLSEASGPPDAWNLSVGAELANPRDRELAVVQQIQDYNLKDKEQSIQFKKISKQFHDSESGRRNKGYTSFISLNGPSDTNHYVHSIVIKIVAGTRQGKELMYTVCDSSPTKTWSTYPGIGGRNINLSKSDHRKKLKSILRTNLLPIEPPKKNQSVDIETSLSAGNYWQIVDLGARPNRARDRVKPNELSSLYNTEVEFWNQHPDINNAKIELARAQNQFGLNSDEVKQAKKELIKVTDQVRSDRPTANMMNNNSVMNVSNIERLIAGSRARSAGNNLFRSFLPQRKKEYLTNLLKSFTDKPNSPTSVYPMTIVDDTSSRSTLTNIGVGDAKSITTDFMEVVHPVAIVSGNFEGTAKDYILEHLGAKSFNDLMRTASVGYGANNTGKLVDSFIYNSNNGVVNKLQLSSKSGAGAPASVKSLEVAYDEALRNPLSKKMWDKEISSLQFDPKYRLAFRLIDLLVIKKNKSWQAAVDLALIIGSITPGDVSLINQWANNLGDIIDQVDNDDENDDDDDTKLKESKRSNKIKIPNELMTKFSKSFKIIYDNSPVTVDNDWAKVIGALWEEILLDINETPAFGNLVVWLFNHSATVQVNTISKEVTTNKKQSLILKRIVGTWPTQLVETAELTRGQGKNSTTIRFELKVNGYPQDLGSANINAPQPLRNKTDLKSMPKNMPNRTTTNYYDTTLSKDEKNLALSRKVGAGTDNFKLPVKSYAASTPVSSYEYVPDLSPPSLLQVQNFFKTYNSEINTNRHIVILCNNIIKNKKYDVQKMYNDFKSLIKNEEILSVIRDETKQLLSTSLSEANRTGSLSLDKTDEYLTILHWSFYIHFGEDKSDTQLKKAREIVDKLSSKIITGNT